MDDLLGEIREVAALGERVLVTTLTKGKISRESYQGLALQVQVLPSDIDTLEHVQILRGLPAGCL